MRILNILNSNKFSGAENVACQIIDMFSGESDIEMAYCCPNGPIGETLAKKGIKYFPIKKLSKKNVKQIIAEYKPDIIHAHDFRASFISSSFSKKLTVISHLHNNVPWLKKLCLKTIAYGLSCRRYNKILTVSNSVFDEFIFGKRFKNKQICIGNPVNTEEIRTKANEYSYSKNFDICICGRLTPPKKPFFSLEILSRLSIDFSAVFIGDGELKEQVEDKINKLGLQGKVELVGFQENPYPIMRNCKLLLMPSLWEGFGLVAVEALSLGLAVVCSGVGGLVNIVNEECGKICKSIDQYVDEIDKLLTDCDYFSQKQTGAYSRSKELENIAKYKEILTQIYHEVR